jgi:hypothetical protein
MNYRIGKIVGANEVPDWERKPPKWTELVDAVMSLEPNQALTVEFDDEKTAERARNAVRDMANLKAKAIIVRTRLQTEENGTVTLYLTRVHPVHPE